MSNVGKIITPTGKLREGAMPETYFREIFSEWFVDPDVILSQQHRTTQAEQWGLDAQDALQAHWEEWTGQKPIETGLIVSQNDPLIAGSPDWLIAPCGGVECKGENTHKHLGYVFGAEEVPADHRAQVHGLMWLCGCDWYEFASFDPRLLERGGMKLALFRVHVEPSKYSLAVADAVRRFADRLRLTLKQFGVQA